MNPTETRPDGPGVDVVDLGTEYLGLRLANPIVASASPLTGQVDDLVRLADAGVAAVVLPSLFEEQIEADALFLDDYDVFDVGAEAAHGHAPSLGHLTEGPDHYLVLIERAVERLSIPVIASLNGVTPGGWTTFAALAEEAGATAIELNVYQVAADPAVTGAELERRTVDLVAEVREVVEIPVAVKLSPYFSSMANMARRLVEAGADGLVLFNRFYQPEVDLELLSVEPRIELSTPSELRLVLRWMAILRGQIPCSLAATTGVHTAEDAVKAILSGADVVMMTSALLSNGPGRVAEVIDGLATWLTERGYASVDQARGSLSQQAIPNPAAVERANYAQNLASYLPPR